MRTAFISDLHSNAEALNKVLKYIESLSVDRFICLGDLVGYNTDHDYCVETVFPLADWLVRGNHDKAVSGLMDINYFNNIAREAVLWTRQAIKKENLELIRNLQPGPLVIEGKFLICHGSPMDEDEYIFYIDTIRECFRFMNKHYEGIDLCFYGHTHVPAIIEENGRAYYPEGLVKLVRGRRYLINSGSVGQPRDGISLASFGVFDDREMNYQLFRVEYEIEKTQNKVVSAGLPPVLARRLANGT